MRRVKNNEVAKPSASSVITKSDFSDEVALGEEIDLKSHHFNLIQTFLMMATGVMLLPAVAVINLAGTSPANMAYALNIVLQILTICAILFACMLLSKIETKIRYVGGK